VDDLPILEVDFRQSTADLSSQFYSIDRRKLAEKSKPGVDRALQGLTYRDEWRCRWRRDCSSLPVVEKAEICERGKNR
jgi:hypothetical protein